MLKHIVEFNDFSVQIPDTKIRIVALVVALLTFSRTNCLARNVQRYFTYIMLCSLLLLLLVLLLQELGGHLGVSGGTSVDGVFLQVDLGLGAGDLLFQLQVVKHTLVEHFFQRPAVAETVVLLFETLVVQFELVEAVGVDVLEHRHRTPGDASPFLQALEGTAVVFVLAHHEVVVVRLAAGADEVGGTQQRRQGGADLLDVGDVQGHRGLFDVLPLVSANEKLAENHGG